MKRSLRAPLGVGFAVLAGVVTMASVAWSCVAFHGGLTASGDGAGSANQTVYAENAFMDLCPSPASWTVTVEKKPAVADISLTVFDPASGAGCAGVDPAPLVADPAYDVMVDKGWMVVGDHADACATNATDIGDMAVDASGNGSGNYSWTASATGPTAGKWNVCVFQTTPTDAIAINVTAV